MEQQLFKGETLENIKMMVRDNAIRKEESTYSTALTQDEIQNIESEHTLNHIKLAKLEEKKKEFMTEYNSEKKPIDEDVKMQLGLIRTGVREVTEDLYLLEDQEEGLMGYYNDRGILIRQRPLRPNEKQFRIITHQKSL